MASNSGGLYVTANTTGVDLTLTSTKYTQGWVVKSNQQGDLTVTESAANSRLTLLPGRYLVALTLSAEEDAISAGTAGGVYFEIRLAQTLVTGLRTLLDLATDEVSTASIVGIVDVAAGSSGQLEVYADCVDVNGTTIIVREAQFTAVQID